jgi:hypothetical protein
VRFFPIERRVLVPPKTYTKICFARRQICLIIKFHAELSDLSPLYDSFAIIESYAIQKHDYMETKLFVPQKPRSEKLALTKKHLQGCMIHKGKLDFQLFFLVHQMLHGTIIMNSSSSRTFSFPVFPLIYKNRSRTMNLSLPFLALLVLFQQALLGSADGSSDRFDSSDNPFGCKASCPALIAGNGDWAGVPRSLMTNDIKDCYATKCTANVGYYFVRGYICMEDCTPQESSSSDRRELGAGDVDAPESADEE